MKSSILALSAAVSMFALAPAHAEDLTGVDPACIVTNADNTQMVDRTKCPDGKTMRSTGAQPPATTTQTEPSTSTENASAAATAPGGEPVIVPPGTLKDAKVMSATTYIGKRVYDTAGNDIGEVNDLIITDDGKIQAVILGVGGFLGLGEKDVAVSISAVKLDNAGSSARLVVNATKEELTSAPAYDRTIQNYAS